MLFESPGFPGPVGQPTVCSLNLVTAPGDCGVQLDVLNANLTPAMDIVCYQDIVMLISSPSTVQSTPFCGMIEGYSTVLEIPGGSTVTLVVLTQNPSSFWKFHIATISCQHNRTPSGKDACGLRGARNARHRWDKVGDWDKVIHEKEAQGSPSVHFTAVHSLKQDAEKFHATVNLRNETDTGTISEYLENSNYSQDGNDEQMPSSINATERGYQDSRFNFIIPVEINIKEQRGRIFQQNIFNIAIQLWKPFGTDEKLTELQSKETEAQSNGDFKLGLTAEIGPDKNKTSTNITELTNKHGTGETGAAVDRISEPQVRKPGSTVASVSQPDIQPSDEGPADSTTRILGGNPILPHQFPWLVALLLDGELQCGAFIISHRWLLTAAHCVTLYTSSEPLLPRFSVYLGAHDISAPNEPHRLQMPLSRIVFHPGHLTILRDIALLQLKESISYSSVIRPICLPNVEQSEALEEAGTVSEVLGWGEVGNGKVSALPLLAPVQVVGRSVCQRAWTPLGVSLPPYTLCSGSQIVGTCNGDSGGALMAQDVDGLYYAIGIISFGAPKCGTPGIPDVHTRIVSYLNWISLVTSNDGTWT